MNARAQGDSGPSLKLKRVGRLRRRCRPGDLALANAFDPMVRHTRDAECRRPKELLGAFVPFISDVRNHHVPVNKIAVVVLLDKPSQRLNLLLDPPLRHGMQSMGAGLGSTRETGNREMSSRTSNSPGRQERGGVEGRADEAVAAAAAAGGVRVCYRPSHSHQPLRGCPLCRRQKKCNPAG